MSANKDETLRQFCDVTGADETRSKFFLESSNWQLEVSVEVHVFFPFPTKLFVLCIQLGILLSIFIARYMRTH